MTKAEDAIKSAVDAVNVDDPKLEGLSLEQIRALADKEQAPPADKKVVEPKKPEPPTEEEEEEDEDQEYEYKIDLGDGSGVQVFKGANAEEVVAKLGEAQKHATIKIREQAERLEKYTSQAAKDAADNEYVIGQE